MKFLTSALEDRPNIRRLVTNFSYFFSEKVTRVVFGFVLQTWLARHLGPEQMGVYSYVADFVAIFIPIVLFGFDDILVKELVRDTDTGKVLGTVFYFRLALSVIVWIALCISIWIIRREARDIFLFSIFYGTIVSVRSLDTFFAYFHAHFLAKNLTRGRQIAYLVASLARAGGLWYGAGIVYFLVNNYIQFFLERFFVILELRKVTKFKLTFDSSYLKKLIPLSLPIALTSFFAYAETRMGTFFLSRFWDLEAVGEFGVGRGLLDLWEFLPITICLTVFPIIVNSKDTSKDAYADKLEKLYGGLFYLGLIFAVSLSITAPWVIRILYGDRFAQTTLVLTYGSYLAIITYVNLARVKWYILEHRTTQWLIICLTTFFLNFAYQFYFTPEYGVYGPHFASIAAHLTGNLLISFFSKTTRTDLAHVFRGILIPVKILLRKALS